MPHRVIMLVCAAMLHAATYVPATAQTPPDQDALLPRVDSIFAAVSDPAAPGCVMAVVHDGRFFFSRS
jgi:CubicO group peptidase (beta-lactamase class C family)